MKRLLNHLPIFALFLFAIATDTSAESVSFDFTTSPQDDGSITDGYVEAAISDRIGFRVDYLDQTTYATEDVPGTDLSLLFTKTERNQVDFTLPLTVPVPRLGVYVGLSYLHIKEVQESVFYVDNLPTEYGNARDALFLSPRVGMKYAENWNTSADPLPIRIEYSLMLSPVYWFTMDQEMTFDYIPEPFTNSYQTISGPYGEQSANIQVGRFLRFSVDHSYLFLEYQSLSQNDAGNIVPTDDPTHMNDLSLGIELTVPVGNDVTFNIGVGQLYNWQYRSADAVSGQDRLTSSSDTVFRVGAGIFDL